MHGWQIAIVLAGATVGHAQLATSGGKANGGDMSFEVASIKVDKGPFKPPSFPLSSDQSFVDPLGRFHADFKLATYIEFAYTIWPTGEEERLMLTGLPEWVRTDRFDIEATAPLHATKEQYREMMRNLLAERFGLKVHFDQREMPVLAMTLLKPGKPGARLIPHAQGQPCEEKATETTFPPECYSFNAMPSRDGLFIAGSRATTMELLGRFVGSMAGASGETGRPVVDQTGLTGLWDFTVEASPPGQHFAENSLGSEVTMLQALHDQLGLQLKAMRATIPVLIIDHVDRPSEN